MSFFQPGDAKTNKTGTTTPSPAAQALAEFRAKILGGLLDSAANRRPTFADFTRGAELPSRLPGGLSAGLPALLSVMSQPGAFTSTSTATGTERPGSPSTLSDLSQLGILGALIYNSGALGGGARGVGDILSSLGGALGIGGVNTALGDSVPAAGAGEALGQNDQNFLDALSTIGSSGEVPSATAGDTSGDLLSAILNYGSY